MKKSEFDLFLEEVRKAGYHSYIWWAAYMWRNLTKKQVQTMHDVIVCKPEVLKVERNGKTIYQFPSGIEWMVE